MSKLDGVTTVTIDTKISAKLDRLAKSNGVTKKNLISLMLDYFEKYGINPTTHESPAQEMHKLIKINDQVIGFIRTQEKEILRPMVESITTTEQRLLQMTATKEDLTKFMGVMQNSYNLLLEQLPKAVLYEINKK